jgi:hypothetical protein
MNDRDYFVKGVIGLVIYFLSTGLSYAAFSRLPFPTGKAPVTSVTPTGTMPDEEIDSSLPRTEACPLNGKLFTKQEKEIWENRRPLAVMIENHAESRPQSGLSKADVVYEAVAEGGITRFMGIFYCGAAYRNTLLAPVRSARTYFLPWALEYDALYNHVGGAGICSDVTVDDRAKALCQIGMWKVKDLDQFGLPFKFQTETGKLPVCYRNYDRLDHEVATEHTMVCETEGLYAVASDRGWTEVDAKGVVWDKSFSQWKFKYDAEIEKRGASFSASFVAWQGYENDYGVKWEYDREDNLYVRYNGGVLAKDHENNKPIQAKTVVIMFARETGPVDEHKHLLYANIGTGDGQIFQDGKVETVTWKKADRTSRTKFYLKNGKEAEFNRGQIWIEMLPVGTKINTN